jgi:2'-5' RNA ligase
MRAAIEKRRLFTAIFPDAGVREALGKASRRIAKQIPQRAVRWTVPEQMQSVLSPNGAIYSLVKSFPLREG